MRKILEHVRRARQSRATAAVAATASIEPDSHAPSSPAAVSASDVERWNEEWLSYLSREWVYQFEPHTAFPDTPTLPAAAIDLVALEMRQGWRMDLYCDATALLGRRVMELGCGCGGLGKLLGRYVASYLGTDYSTLALKVARLVSPSNCSYIHLADQEGLRWFRGSIDTVVGRHFWIHQNLELARENLRFLTPFLVPGGRVYADFFYPDEGVEQFIVLPASSALSKRYPSATFRYEPDDVSAWTKDQPYRVLRQEVVRSMQRRYVVLERLADPSA